MQANHKDAYEYLCNFVSQYAKRSRVKGVSPHSGDRQLVGECASLSQCEVYVQHTCRKRFDETPRHSMATVLDIRNALLVCLLRHVINCEIENVFSL
jgi:hypothetical protein